MALGAIDPSAMRVARAVARDLMRVGARAVVLTGSHARGDAHRESDIDLLLIGRGPDGQLSRRGGLLVSISWWTLSKCRHAFDDPDLVGSVVSGWRDAIILYDPEGIAGRLQARARSWRWERIAKASDRWVAEQVTGLAEEVQQTCGE